MSFKASLEGQVKIVVDALIFVWRLSPGALCSLPGGQSSLTPPPCRRPDRPAAAAAPGRSSFGLLYRGLTAQPA